jgi:hypothetical protein
MNAEQERAAAYTHPTFTAETARWSRHLARDGIALGEDLRGGKLGSTPTIIVSAGERAPNSVVRRAHQQLAAWIPGSELQVWSGTTHPLHIQQPRKVLETLLALLTDVTHTVGDAPERGAQPHWQ